MIKNQKQYNITKKKIEQLQFALDNANFTNFDMSENMFEVMKAGIQSQIDDLQNDLLEYDSLPGKERIKLESFPEIGQLLIKSRIAKGLTQKELAELIGIKPQQIQQYEKTDYEKAGLSRIYEVFDAMEIELNGTLYLNSFDSFSYNCSSEYTEMNTGSRAHAKSISFNNNPNFTKFSDWANPNEYREAG